jgi:hypothetical protein
MEQLCKEPMHHRMVGFAAQKIHMKANTPHAHSNPRIQLQVMRYTANRVGDLQIANLSQATAIAQNHVFTMLIIHLEVVEIPLHVAAFK